MINENDILDMSCLTRDEIAAVAGHEHIDLVHAAEFGDYMMHIHHGPQTVQRMICEDIRAALQAGDITEARALFATLKGFLASHPEALRGNS